ncbi:MAG: nickel pincer cofactor biosynthesis protein LarB [Candidatus Obscuribacterales bacterium]|nr:nickel pincer cofactor biosynthesis protein LarB [Candidatus Obscuribacterales bacterium]
MDPQRLEQLLSSVVEGKVSIDAALKTLKSLPFANLEFAKPDLHRSLRQGASETILAQGKTAEQIAAIAACILETQESVVATRCDASQWAFLNNEFATAQYHELARIAVIGKTPITEIVGFSPFILTAGTADLPVAEESAVILEHLGFAVNRIYDVGVAGLHRLLSKTSELQTASVIIVVAGMDGALPSVVGGLVSVPVIAVPTSIGYGSSFGGIAPLLTMLNSCAHGITVMNIDNGFGAAMAVHRIFQSTICGAS